MARAATFDEHDHATIEGWATYQNVGMIRWRLRCRFGRHILPTRQPSSRHGHDNYDRCPRCRSFLRWYVIGQHRYGGLDAARTALGKTP